MCQLSENAATRSQHRDVHGQGQCQGSPLFFSQCYCNPTSDLRRFFKPKDGYGLVFVPKPIVPVWISAWEKFYDPAADLGIRFLICHGEYGKGAYAPSDVDYANLRCEYPSGSLPEPGTRLYKAIGDEDWIGQGVPHKSPCHYIILTTPGSYETRLFNQTGYRFPWSAQADPPLTGPGSRVTVRFNDCIIPGLSPAWILVDEFHLIKSISRNKGPWHFIQRLHAVQQTIPSLVAISGTPISIGPGDIMGPLMCFKDHYAAGFPGTHPDDLDVEALEKIDINFTALMKTNPNGDEMDSLIRSFGQRFRFRALRRIERSKWGKWTVLRLPPQIHTVHNVDFPPQFLVQLQGLREAIQYNFDKGAGSRKEKATPYAKSFFRQELLISTVPWLAEYWQDPRSRNERFLAQEYSRHFLDPSNNNDWLDTHPLHDYKTRYANDGSLPKFQVLDGILLRAQSKSNKVVIFSQYIALASFAQHVSDSTFSQYMNFSGRSAHFRCHLSICLLTSQ